MTEAKDLVTSVGDLIKKHDWLEAERVLKANEPFAAPMTCSWLVACLENLGKGLEADAAIVKALDAFSDSYTLHGQYARRLQARGETERALRHYAYMRRRWPQIELAWCEEIKTLWALNRHQAAEPLLAGLGTRFPASMEAHRLEAENLTRKKAWGEALDKWSQFRAKFPASLHGFRRAIDIYLTLGRIDEADALARTMHSDAEPVSGSCFIRRANSPDVLIVFSAFDIPLGFFPGGDNLFTPQEFAANVIIVNDYRKHWYLEGIYGLGDNFLDAAKALGNIRDSLLGEGGQTICYGNSMGAYGACLYGSLMGADLCLAPGLQAFAPNPVGTFKKFSGKRPRLENFIKNATDTYFHVLVGEREFGDLFGCIRLAKLQNVHLETARNAGHGVTDYLATRKGIRQTLHFYLDGLRADSAYKSRLLAGCQRWNAIDLDDQGSLPSFPKIGAWLYASLIALIYPDRKNHALLAEKLVALASTLSPSYIRGYLYEMSARLFHRAGMSQKALELGEMSFFCNPANSYAAEFLAQVALILKKYDQALRHATRAISLKNTNMAQGIYRPNRCYDACMEALNQLGKPELALASCDAWLLRRGMTNVEQNHINLARKRSFAALANSSAASPRQLYSGAESWRWKVAAQLWEWARDYGEAARALGEYLKLKPGDMALVLKRIDLYRQADDDAAAAAVALQELEKQPWGPGLRRLAQIAEKAGKLSEALIYCQKAREAEPQNAFHDLLLAQLHCKLGEPDKAETFALPHLDNARTRPYALEQMSFAAETRGETAKAIEYLRQAQHCLPENASYESKIRTLESGAPASSPPKRKPELNAALERDALYFALDMEPDSLSMHLRLAVNLRPSTFAGALAILDAGLAQKPDWQEGQALREQYTREQAEWRKKHS